MLILSFVFDILFGLRIWSHKMLRKIKCKSAGATLLEALIALAIISILIKLAVASYSRLFSQTQIIVAASELHAALLFARSEALKRGGNVIICRSTSANAPYPVCNADHSDSDSNSGWGDGWIIFHDSNGDGRLSDSEDIIRVQGRLFLSNRDGSIIPTPNRKQIKFNSFGQVYGVYMQFAIVQSHQEREANLERYICIASGGRARIDKVTCSGR
ncbi:GspH/FimT family pseudopilin [Undibacterium flavidum]|uniref:Type II secretion system protein H n=1 Tax=Undibacterium flavidum TaxID=2762297 RepID=A0ABR6YDH2_9BURK|nr:GspH/FimT family pseudopilin [Undibacterium flavidum]MBC3874611.1 GspH/FimT family pseudopilin [Undibacterium flavidum]